jgi:hypothetical protein
VVTSGSKLDVKPPGRGPATVHRDRGLPAFSLSVGRGPSALDEEAPEAAPAPEQTAAPAPIAPATLPASAGRLDVSQPGDPLEREADQTADRALRHLAPAPGGAASEPPLPPPAFAPRLLVQRTSLVEVAGAATGLTGGPLEDRDRAGGLLVDDETETLTAGQMKKTPFLDELRRVAREVADRELRKVGSTADGCPYIDQLLARYATRPAAALERSIRRYAPEARGATRALEYLRLVAAKLGHGVAAWATTGRVPDGLPPELGPGEFVGTAVLGGAPQLETADGVAGRTSVDAAALTGRLGAGHALDGGARARMESALGHSFGEVRVHTDDRAAALSRDLDARAFTVGSHVAFGASQFHPGDPAGDALLAHELAHVVQQRGAAPYGDVPVGNAGDTLERDADATAAGAVARLGGARSERLLTRLASRARGGVSLQRCRDEANAPAEAKAPVDVKAERIKALKKEKAELEAIVASGSGKSMGEVGSAYTRLADVSHDLQVLETGTGIYEGNQCPTTTPGAIRTDCTDIVLKVLEQIFTQQGKAGDWAKVKTKYAANSKARGDTKLSGLDVQAALQSEAGWKGIYWAPDPSYLVPKAELSKARSDEASYTSQIAKSKGTYYKDYHMDHKTKGYPGVSVGHSVTNYAPEAPNAGHGDASTTTKDTSQLDKLKKLPFGVLSAHAGQHMTLITYGKVIEVHWKETATSVDVVEQTDLEKWAIGPTSGYHYYASGVIVAPAADVDKAFK